MPATLYSGSCPHCGARIALTTAPPAIHVCASCQKRSTLVVPEGEPGGVRELSALPLGDALADPRRAMARRWARGLLALAGLGCVALAGLLALALLTGTADNPSTRRFVGAWTAGFVRVLFAIPFQALCALPIILFLFRRESAGRTAGWRLAAVIAVTGGWTACAVLSLLLHGSVALVRPGWPGAPALDALAYLGAGAVTVRLARAAPYRNVAALALLTLVPLPLLFAEGALRPGALLTHAGFLTAAFLGAWIALRTEGPVPAVPVHA